MKIDFKQCAAPVTTFADIEPSQMFVYQGTLYLKWDTTQAICLSGDGDVCLIVIGRHADVKRVHSITVLTE
jgi:hypothetical protein